MGTHEQDALKAEVPGEDQRSILEAQRADEEIVYIRTPNGAIWPMALPLHETIADQVAKGQSVQVNEDGTPWEPSDDDPDLVLESEGARREREHLAGLEYARLKQERPDADPIELRDEAADTHGDPIPENAPRPGDHVEGVHSDDREVGRPKPGAPKAEWVTYAESQGLTHDEADGHTKAELVDRFGK